MTNVAKTEERLPRMFDIVVGVCGMEDRSVKTDPKKDTGMHFLSVRQNLRTTMIQVRKVREERDARTAGESRPSSPRR